MNDKTIKKVKVYDIKPTKLHRKAVKTLVESSSKRDGLLKAGYSQAVADNPIKVTESRGFIKAMEDMGLTDDLLNGMLIDDLHKKGKKGNRFNELQLAYKLKGHLKDTKEGNKTLILNISGQAGARFTPVPTPIDNDIE